MLKGPLTCHMYAKPADASKTLTWSNLSWVLKGSENSNIAKSRELLGLTLDENIAQNQESTNLQTPFHVHQNHQLNSISV